MQKAFEDKILNNQKVEEDKMRERLLES